MNWVSEIIGRKFAAFLAFLVVSYLGAQLPPDARDLFLGVALKGLAAFVGAQGAQDIVKAFKSGS